MTKTTNHEEKRILGHAGGMYVLYMCVSFSLEQICQLLVTKFALPLFSMISHIRIFILLLYLHIDYLSPTPGGLRLHSQDFCLIWNVLVSFCSAI